MTQGLYGQELATTEQNPMRALMAMVERGGDPDTIGKFMDLAERWEANRAKRAFAEAMTAVQTEMPIVVKDRLNSSTNSRFAAIETIQAAARQVWLKHGFSVTFSDGESSKPDWIRVTAVVRHDGGHSETFYRDGPMDNVGMKGAPTKTALHGVQSTATYLQRRLTCSIFGIVVADEDLDGNAANVETIAEEDAIKITEMLEALGGDNYRRFLEWVGVDEIRQIPASRAVEVIGKLKGKLREAGK